MPMLTLTQKRPKSSSLSALCAMLLAQSSNDKLWQLITNYTQKWEPRCVKMSNSMPLCLPLPITCLADLSPDSVCFWFKSTYSHAWSTALIKCTFPFVCFVVRSTSMCSFWPWASHRCSFHLDKLPSHNPCMPITTVVDLAHCVLTSAHQLYSIRGGAVSVLCAACCLVHPTHLQLLSNQAPVQCLSSCCNLPIT